MEMEFGARLNIMTGDNGLGKSFLLDIIWWVLTRKWPQEVNSSLTAGKIALPRNKKAAATISSSFSGASGTQEIESSFKPKLQSWSQKAGRPPQPGFVFYAMADGGFAVWDPARNYWNAPRETGSERPASYVFSPKDVWDGLQKNDGSRLCNGLILDWASWQKERGTAFETLQRVMRCLSPAEEPIIPGELTRISLDDVRDMPTLRMPYGLDVPVVHASSGMRRIISLAYFLVWCWEEHKKAKDILGEPLENRAVLLLDEAESHLHPKWQRKIIPAILNVMKSLSPEVEVQLIASSHSPLIMSSLEPIFDARRDSWFDFDLRGETVELSKRAFFRRGTIGNWLTSEAFDLESSYSEEAEKAIREAG
ncbi:MAG: ATP-binding protein [Mailhella sp.]|nr:ATP-binding protein [Mailhella sp.]